METDRSDASLEPSPAHSRFLRRRETRRYGFACTNCKSRKVKCSGEQPICRACQRSGATCTWQTASAEKQLQHAASRIRQLEQTLQDVSMQGPPSTVSDQTPSETSPSITSGQSIWFQVGVGDDGTVTYNGPTSRFHAGPLENSTDDVAQANQGQRGADLDAINTQYDLLGTVWAPLIHSKTDYERLGLDKNMCMTLLDIYWTWLQPLHNCVYRPSFLMDMAFGGRYYSDFLLLCILSLSARHLSENDKLASGIKDGETFLSQAKELLLEEMAASKPRIPTIQGLLIIGGRQCAMGKSSEGWLYTGMALRMLVDIGLHLHIDDTKLIKLEGLTPIEIETRKRLYNSAYIWDKTISLALGRPPSLTRHPYPAEDILDHNDDSREWKPIYAPEIGETYTPVPSHNTSNFCAHSELHKITTEMMLLFSNASTVPRFTTEIKGLDAKFTTWYTELPLQLRIDDLSHVLQSPPPHIVSLNLLYHALCILLYRPSLGSQDDTFRSLGTEICISHSKRIHEIFSLYERTFPYRLMTYQVSYCIFTAATVEAFVIKNPDPHKATEAAKRLGDAMRVLHHETKHTPGISQSLDTIRRRLANWKPISRPIEYEHWRPPPSRLESNVSGRSANSRNPDFHDAANRNTPASRTGPLPHERELGNSASSEAHNAVCDDGLASITGNSSFAGIDTGAGFHPDAFPWSLTDLLNVDNGFGPFWGQVQPWNELTE